MNFKMTIPAALVACALSGTAEAKLLQFSFSGPEEATFYIDSYRNPDEWISAPIVQRFLYEGVKGTIRAYGRIVPVHYTVAFFGPTVEYNDYSIDALTVDYIDDLDWVEPGWEPNNFFFTSTLMKPESADQILFDGHVSDPILRTGMFEMQDWFTTDGTYRDWTMNVTEATAAVPEPSAWMTMTLGFGLLGAAMRRRIRSPLRVA